MGRKPNPKISGFRQRVEWIVEYLDPDPSYARFVSEPNDVYTALASAVEHGRYELAPGFADTTSRQALLHQRNWQTALQNGVVSPHFVTWLCDLFPDLTREQLLCANLDEFYRLGRPAQEARKAWSPAARFYSTDRKALHGLAMAFYAPVQSSMLDGRFPIPFPLLIRPGWIRQTPLPLEETTESPFLSTPAQLRRFGDRRLQGLSGDYVTYRGKIGFSKRRKVNSAPQHSGEIFCANTVIDEAGDFVGFRYDLAMYFDYINTGEILGIELARHFLEMGEGAETLPPSFPLRGAPEAAFDFSNRAAYPGVNCLTVFLNYAEPGLKRGNWFLLHKRDETQLQAQNSVHVVPAGGHQGFAKGAQAVDTAIWRTVVREFAEELFDQEGLYKQPETWSDFMLVREVSRIRESFFDAPKPAAKIYLHGFGLDPITLKPEILCTIVIDWSKLPEGRFKLKYNWELQTANAKVTRHQWVPLSKEGLIRQATERCQTIDDRPLDALPAGAACMLLTAEQYDFLGLPHPATRALNVD